ncbi:MAG TPA: hypothetical protein EYN32_02080 [Phycisphaerales bacterium]|nr:hypothetical protein [Phycisphaerales bacterium]
MRNIKMPKKELSNKQLRTLASRQHYTIIGIVFIIVFSALAFFVAYVDGDESIVYLLEACTKFFVLLAAINSILLVCSTYGPIGGFFVALCFALVLYYLPVIAVLLLLGINQQATAILRSHDIKVGLLGADKKQFAGKT